MVLCAYNRYHNCRFRRIVKEKILYANELVFQIWGCESWEEFQELTGGSFCGMVDAEDLERVEKSIRK